MRASLLSLLVCSAVIQAPVFAQSQPPEELFVPILINGVVRESSHYQTVFRFVELSGTTASPAVTVQVDIFDNLGKRIDPDELYCNVSYPPNPVRVNLPGNGSFHVGTPGRVLGYQPTLSLMDGWARLTATPPGRLQATAELLQVAGLPDGCPFTNLFIPSQPSDLYRSDAVVHAVKPAKVFRAAAVITAYRHTAFSVVNPSATETAHVFIELFEMAGGLLQRGLKVDIPPMQRRSAFAWEWAAPPPTLPPITHVVAPDYFFGSARIISDVPVAFGALQVLLPGGKLVSALVTPEP